MSVDLNDGNLLLGVCAILRDFFEEGKKPTLHILCHFDGIEAICKGV